MFRRQSSPTATVSIAGEIAVDKWVALGKKRERETDSLCAISLSPVTMLQEGRQIFMGEALLFLCNKKPFRNLKGRKTWFTKKSMYRTSLMAQW